MVPMRRLPEKGINSAVAISVKATPSIVGDNGEIPEPRGGLRGRHDDLGKLVGEDGRAPGYGGELDQSGMVA